MNSIKAFFLLAGTLAITYANANAVHVGISKPEEIARSGHHGGGHHGGHHGHHGHHGHYGHHNRWGGHHWNNGWNGNHWDGWNGIGGWGAAGVPYYYNTQNVYYTDPAYYNDGQVLFRLNINP
jgi:hypothetical protein